MLTFLAGLAVGLFIAAYLTHQVNERWYRLARKHATETAAGTAAALRELADWIPDPDLSATVKREADKLEQAWP